MKSSFSFLLHTRPKIGRFFYYSCDTLCSTMTSREIAVLLLPAFKHYCGKTRRAILIKLQHEFWDETPDKTCWLCHKWVKFKHKSVDHVVPISICIVLDLLGLVFDKRNFRIAHLWCNSNRHHDISMLPEPIIAKLRDRGYNVDN